MYSKQGTGAIDDFMTALYELSQHGERSVSLGNIEVKTKLSKSQIMEITRQAEEEGMIWDVSNFESPQRWLPRSTGISYARSIIGR